MTRMKLPEMPGRIIVQTAIAPQMNINHRSSGVVVGDRVQMTGRTFDLVVEDSPSHELGPSDAFKEITRYLETIIQ